MSRLYVLWDYLESMHPKFPGHRHNEGGFPTAYWSCHKNGWWNWPQHLHVGSAVTKLSCMLHACYTTSWITDCSCLLYLTLSCLIMSNFMMEPHWYSTKFEKQAFDSIAGNTVVPYRSLKKIFIYHKLLFIVIYNFNFQIENYNYDVKMDKFLLL